MSGRFDIVLMDVNLPDISGLEATATIRSLEHSAGRDAIPIIAMTAGAMKGDRERAIAAGMNDYLAKPVAIELLKRVLELWLARVKTRQPST
jgi:CheY-like chemotaxis protein